MCALHLLKHVRGLNTTSHSLLGGLLDLPSDQELIQDEVGLLKVKDDVQLTYLQGGTAISRHVIAIQYAV